MLLIVNSSLWAQSARVVIPVGHADAVEEILFRPDGRYLVTASTNDTKLWEAETGRFINTFRGASPLFSADGKYLITSSPTRIFDVVTGSVVAEVEGGQPKISADGEWLITQIETDNESDIGIWHFPDGKLLRKLEEVGSGGTLSSIISPDFKLLMSTNSSEFGNTYSDLWEIATGNKVGTYPGIWDAAFTADGQYIVMAEALITESKTYLRVLDVASKTIIKSLEGHTFLIVPDGKTLLLGLSGAGYQVWDGSSLKPKFQMEAVASILAFSPDGSNALATTSTTNTAWLIDMKSGQFLDSLRGTRPDSYVAERTVEYSPDGKYVALKNRQKDRIWLCHAQPLTMMDSLTGREFAFSPDSKSFAFYDHGTGLTIRQLDVSKQFTFPVIENNFWRRSLTVSGDGNFLASSISINRPDFVNIRDIRTGKATLEAYERFLSFNADGSLVATSGNQKERLLIREVSSGTIIQSVQDADMINGHGSGIGSARFTPDGKSLITLGDKGGQAVTWQIPTMEYSGPTEDPAVNIEISLDGKLLALAAEDRVRVLDRATNKIVRSLDIDLQSLFSTVPVFSPFSKFLAVYSPLDAAVALMNLQSGKAMTLDPDENGWVDRVAFSPDEKYILVTRFRSNDVWDTGTGELIKEFSNTSSGLFGHESNQMYLGTEGGIVVRKVGTWEKVKTFGPGGFDLLHLDEAGSRLFVTNKAQLAIIDLKTGESLLTLTDIDSSDWVVTHSSGLFDASPGAINKLYFRTGIELIEFGQLKERYYEPGLWKKIMAGENLRSVAAMKSIDLPPDIEVGQVDAQGFLPIQLNDRGGGIGEVTIYINGKEAIKDARTIGVDPNTKSLSLKVSIANHKSLVKGTENLVGVKAWNAGHWVVSRGKIVSFNIGRAEAYKPSIYILACGVSDYTGNELDLKFAAKDAEDMAQATRLGAEKLFGTASSSVYTLTTNQSKDHYPTKANILKAFEKISMTAKPLDVFVMYISGHGINYGGPEGDWYYLTQDAYTASSSAYNDPGIRQQTTLSSNELVELFKKLPALKQVLIVDACASGKVVDNLMAQKDVSSTTLRALDRMRDRTGMHIITGCTADAVSYEASKYGQGVLTYSLLEGIRGAALREDQFVDVNKLFQYAEERVPTLAEGLGGIQTPQVFSPQGSQSFDIGLLSETEKKAIPIARIRPVYIRSNFQDENEMEDVLNLSKEVDQSLNEVSAKGSDASIIFVDVREYPDACKLIGRYRKDGGKINLKLRRKCGAEDRTFDLTADNVEKLRQEIMKVL